ncbi:MAG: RICIN domain-containing protein [Rhodanobacteraceae bacterium]|nr:RICIN domain-containing protein [Rhodanobacteraceae bacterium]
MNLLVTGTEFKSYGLEETTWSREFPRWDGTSSGMCNGADTLMTGLSCSGTNRDCQVLNIQCSKFYGLRRDDCYWRPAFSDEGAGRDILPPQQFAAGLRCSGTSCDNVEIFACSVGSGSGTRESLSDVVKIMSVHSQQYFDVQGAGMSSGVPVVQNSLSLSSNQDFVLHPASDTNVDDAFLIRPMHSALCLEVANASMANDAGLVQSACDVRRENQHFSLRELSGGTFQIVARHSEKCIGVLNSSTTRGAQFVQSTCINGRVSHQFKFFTSY